MIFFFLQKRFLSSHTIPLPVWTMHRLPTPSPTLKTKIPVHLNRETEASDMKRREREGGIKIRVPPVTLRNRIKNAPVLITQTASVFRLGLGYSSFEWTFNDFIIMFVCIWNNFFFFFFSQIFFFFFDLIFPRLPPWCFSASPPNSLRILHTIHVGGTFCIVRKILDYWEDLPGKVSELQQQSTEKIVNHIFFFEGHFRRGDDPISKITRTFISGTRTILFFFYCAANS